MESSLVLSALPEEGRTTSLTARSLLHIRFVLNFDIPDEPEYDPKSQSRSGESRNDTRSGLIEIENNESAHQCKQRDQDNGAHLDDGSAVVLDYQQCVLEFECDEDGEHHTKEALEDLRLGRIDHMTSHKLECMQKELPGGASHDESGHQREYRNDSLLESLIERECFPFGLQLLDLASQSKYLVRHRPSAGLLSSPQSGCQLRRGGSANRLDRDTHDRRPPVPVLLSHSLPKATRFQDSLLSGRPAGPRHYLRQPSLSQWGY